MIKKTLLALSLMIAVVTSSQAQLGKVVKKATSKNNQEALKKAVTAVKLTDADVKKYSKEAVDWMDENNPVADPETDPYGKRLANLVKGLENYDGLNLNYKVYLVRDVNAFATADGSVRVFAGLMDLMTDDQLMSVIGHEIGHVKNEHSLKQMKKALSVSALSQAIAENTSTGRALSDAQLTDLMEGFLNAQFSQKDESESDDYGFVFMVEHGDDYHAQAEAFDILAGLSDDGGKGSLMSSHPGSAKRADLARAKAKKQDESKK